LLLPCSVLLIFADSHALIWRGALHGVKGDRYPRTVFRTFFEVILPPLGVIMLAHFFLVATNGRKETVYGVVVVWTIFSVLFDAVLGRAARGKLKHLRTLVAGGSEDAAAFHDAPTSRGQRLREPSLPAVAAAL
jgi:hypothetical protein